MTPIPVIEKKFHIGSFFNVKNYPPSGTFHKGNFLIRIKI
jgi:hypothetical protein